MKIFKLYYQNKSKVMKEYSTKKNVNKSNKMGRNST